MEFIINHTDPKSNARAGLIKTDHGDIHTPIFMPVGTVGSVKAVHIKELREDIQAEILKVPHHGRYEKNMAALVEKVSPEYAIITSGTIEPEDAEVMQILEAAGVTTYLNREGNITITMSSDNISITQ